MFGQRFSRALAVATAMTLTLTSVAFADQVVGDADADAVASPHANERSASQQAGTTVAYDLSGLIKETGNAGDDVFRAGQTDTVEVTITRGGDWLAASSGSPASWTFSAYNVSQSGTIRVSVPCDAANNASKTMTAVLTGIASNGRAISGETLSWTITATTPAAATCTPSDSVAPTSAASATNADNSTYTFNSWTNQNVTVSLSATDNTGGSGIKELTYRSAAGSAQTISATTVATANLPATVAINTEGTTTIEFWAKDNANNTETAQTVVVKLDKTAPSILDGGLQAGTEGVNGWYISAVTNRFTASDALSGLSATCDAAFGLTDDAKDVSTGTTQGSTVTVNSGSCSDAAGNTNSGLDSAEFKVDLVAPVISRNAAADSCDEPGTGGWCRGTQTAGFTATDATSGIAPTGASPLYFTQSSSTEGDVVTISSGTRSDMAGHAATAINAGPFKIDSTDPTVTCGATPTFMLGQTAATVSATVSDSTSGALSTPVSDAANTSLASGGTVSLTGKDNAGNETTVQCPYNVASVTFGQPIEGSSVMNIAKLGRVVPVKASILINGNPVGPNDGPVYLQGLRNISCTAGASTDAVEEYAAGSSNTGNQFRWDSTAQRWMYNLDTSALGMKASTCYQIDVSVGGTVDAATGKASGGARAGFFLLRTNK